MPARSRSFQPARADRAHPSTRSDPSTRKHPTARTQLSAPNRGGVHLLTSAAVVDGLVRSSGVGPGDLVLDLGAGPGTLTTRLAATGARVLAVERDPHLVRRLERRCARDERVRVVAGDILSVPLPRRPFAVVANIPFAISTRILRRLLDERDGVTSGADLVVEWGLARRLTEPQPRSLETAWWAARYEITLRRRIPAGCFTPAPDVDAAHLNIRARPRMRGSARMITWQVLSAAYRYPGQPARRAVSNVVTPRRAHRLLTSSGIDPPMAASRVRTEQWMRFAAAVAAESPDR
jgi:23S rRNA (adenine-N6)-dimethyltransferase